MKKNISYVKTGGNQAFHEDQRTPRVTPFHIYERPAKLHGAEYDEECKSYIQSFMKQRMLMIWKSQRNLLQIAPMFPEPLESKIYKNVYERIKPLLVGAYHEDFHRSNEFTFQSWLETLQNTAQLLQRSIDVLYWGEIVKFIQEYSDHPNDSRSPDLNT